jgi:biotin carboxyl carrier protein
MQHRFRYLDRHLSVSLQRLGEGRYEATVDDQRDEIEASLVDPATLHVVWRGKTRIVHIARVGSGYQVAIDGEVYTLAPEAAGSAAHTPTLAAPQITAPMPGKVLQVLVREGQEVNSGDGLIILEAMKMENRIVAEAPAVVKKVHVADGQMVDGGQVLIELEYKEESRV